MSELSQKILARIETLLDSGQRDLKELDYVQLLSAVYADVTERQRQHASAGAEAEAARAVPAAEVADSGEPADDDVDPTITFGQHEGLDALPDDEAE